MSAELTIAIAQTNPTVGDIPGNVARIRAARADAAAAGADLVVYSELVVVGYPPEDLVLKHAFQDEARRAVEELADDTADGGPALIVGAPWVADGKLYNAMLLLRGGRIVTARYKHDLPNYGVFDEKRVFAAGPVPGPMAFPLPGGSDQMRLGGMVCEDMWTGDVAEGLEESGAEILIVPNGSPFEHDKQDVRLNLAVARVTETGLPLIYCNQVGGQDELVFDGASFVLNRRPPPRGAGQGLRGGPAADEMAARRRRDVGVRRGSDRGRGRGAGCDLPGDVPGPARLRRQEPLPGRGAGPVRRHRFRAVRGGRGRRPRARAGARGDDAVALHLGGEHRGRPGGRPGARHSPGHDPDRAGGRAFGAMLEPVFAGRPPDITEENLQARIRGVILMALSNKLGSMVLTTGNKSEMSVGYATLYGDMCGGYSVLKDVYKTTVFALARWRNQQLPARARGPAGTVIPERVIVKPPSAELRANQTDQDSLPPYDELDAILQGLVEQDLSARELVAKGHDPAVVRRVSNLLDLAEYKRRQAPPGVKITRKAFGRDRRYPITNAFRKVGLSGQGR